MVYQVVLSPSACRDLENIVRSISFDRPRRAIEIGQLLLEKAKSLAEYPEIGRMVPEFNNPNIREIVVFSEVG